MNQIFIDHINPLKREMDIVINYHATYNYTYHNYANKPRSCYKAYPVVPGFAGMRLVPAA